MADPDPPPPLPTPTAQTAVKQAVATAHDAPDRSPVDGESPLPARPLFTRPSSLTAEDDIFDNSDDDECLVEMSMPPSTSSSSRKRDDNDEEDVDALGSPPKRLKTAPELSSPPPSMSQSSLPSNMSPTPVIKRVGDIPRKYLDSDAEEEDSDYDGEDMFDIDNDIIMQTLDPSDPRRIEWNKKNTIHNNIHNWARAEVLSTQSPIPETDDSFKRFEQSFSKQIHHRFNESRRNSDVEEDDGVRVTRASSQAAAVDDKDLDALNLDTTDSRRLSRLMFEDIITVREGTALKLYVSETATNNTAAWWQDSFQFAAQSLKLKCIRMHSRDFYVFDVTISCDTEHQCITAGTTSLSDLETKFKRNDGFHISFNNVSKSDGRPLIIPVSWCQFISNAYDIMFFAPPIKSTRVFTYALKDKDSPDAIRQLFRVLSNEVIGDYGLAYSLYTAYLSRLLKVTSNKSKSTQQLPDNLCSFDNHTRPSQAFFKAFDDYSKQCLDGIIDGWSSLSQPIITLDKFHEAAEDCSWWLA
eukprot:scaffold217_cov64-Cyclotella_meneghiniana.AAC.5